MNEFDKLPMELNAMAEILNATQKIAEMTACYYNAMLIETNNDVALEMAKHYLALIISSTMRLDK